VTNAGVRGVSLSAVDEAPLKWTGQDEFSALGDRSADAPLPLPALSSPARVVLVRHGQSTWNAAGRMQGSSDLSILTAKGEVQAQATCTTVCSPSCASTAACRARKETARPKRRWKNGGLRGAGMGMIYHNAFVSQLAAVGFSKLYRSPLKRASRTAEIVWGERTGPVEDLPSLREVDLYSLQGLIKVCAFPFHLHAPVVESRLGVAHPLRARAPTAQDEGLARFGHQYRRWQKSPNDFEMDGHFPVRCDVCVRIIIARESPSLPSVATNLIRLWVGLAAENCGIGARCAGGRF